MARAPKKQKPHTWWRDYLDLTKPSITAMCVMMTFGGYWLAARNLSDISWFHLLVTIVGTTLIVGGSCALNMFMERKNDLLMKRTATRPLPSGRISARAGLIYALALSIGGFLLLTFMVNAITGILAAIALGSYIGLYTPMKRKTPVFLLIGTIPGAIPPLLGWTAFTGEVQLPGLILFSLLVFWQLPHFLALSLMLKNDYAKAGIQVVPLVHGDHRTRLMAFAYTLTLLPVSLALVPLQVAGPLYFAIALFAGLWFLWVAWKGLTVNRQKLWPRKLFFASLIYLPLIALALFLDMVIPGIL